MLSKFRRFSILVRSTVFCVVIVAVVGCVVAVSAVSGRTQQRNADELGTAVDTMRLAQQVKYRISDLALWNTTWALDSTLGPRAAINPVTQDLTLVRGAAEAMQAELGELLKQPLMPEEKRFVEAAAANHAEVLRLSPSIAGAFAAKSPAERAKAPALVRRASALVAASAGNIDQAVKLIVDRVKAQQREGKAAYADSRLVVLGLGALAPAAGAQEWVDPGPGRWQAGDKEIVVSLWQQRLWAYEGDVAVLAPWVSTGTAETWEVETPVGQWQILVKFPYETMAGTVNGEDYYVPDVPHVMYFTNEGHALHGTYWHSNFGAPMSHGCVNLPLDVGAWLYEWAPVGTPVTVIP